MKDNIVTYEESNRYGKPSYIIQPCPVCTVNHDYKLKGRTVMCTCGCYIKETEKGKLIRVG